MGKLGETSTLNAKEHENLKNIPSSMLRAEFFTLKKIVVRETPNKNAKIWEMSFNSGKHKNTKALSNLKTKNKNKT